MGVDTLSDTHYTECMDSSSKKKWPKWRRTVSMPPGVYIALCELAAADGIPMAAWVQRAIETAARERGVDVPTQQEARRRLRPHQPRQQAIPDHSAYFTF